MAQPSTPLDEPRSPGSTTSSSPAPFIYPIRSAVSVKPVSQGMPLNPGSTSSRKDGSSNDGDNEGPSVSQSQQRQQFNLHLPSESRVKMTSSSSNATLQEDAGPSTERMDEDYEDEAQDSRQSWSEEETRSQASVEDSRMMKEGGYEARKTTSMSDRGNLRRPSGGFASSVATDRSNMNASERDTMETMTQPRFRHVETEDGNMVVTGRDGEITRCEDEPIHIPGAVQSFGCMVVVREDEEGMLRVRQVSENTTDVLSLSPKYLFSLESFLDCLDDDQADTLWDNIEALEETEEELSEAGPHVFKLSGWGQPGPGRGKARARKHWDCWCALHRIKSVPQDIEESDWENPKWKIPLTVMEFELIKDDANPLEARTPPSSPDEENGMSHSRANAGSSAADSSSPPSAATTDSDGTTKITSALTMSSKSRGGLEGMPYIPTPEQFVESTQSSSKPITAIQRMRRRVGGSQGARQRPRRRENNAPGFNLPHDPASGGTLDLFGILSQVNEQFAAQTELSGFLKVAVSVIREVTGFSRVMMYQFDEHWNGQVVCELVDWNDTHDLYRGLHFPATDIPKQARDMYMINKVRLLYDRDQPSARMVCREADDLKTPINMTHSFLRAMSPIHIKYLANMGVRASMSISVVAFDQLWGLIALHTYGSKGKRVSFPMRQLCRLIGDSVSRNIERLSYTRRLSSKKLINTLPTEENPSGYIISNAEDLLKLFDADFGVIAIRNEAKILGPLSASQEVLAMTEYLRLKKFQQVVTSQDVAKDFPDMVLPNGLEVIAGLLVVPLSGSGIDFITFMRKAQTRHVNWAGKPYKSGQEGTAVLEPRKSFKIWSETVTGTCRGWKDEELETASVLCLVYGKFISVWRQREQAMQFNHLNKLLLSNATHEVRTPLNHIINYLEMALDSQLDDDTRENLSKSHMASKSLLFVINDLLDLTRHEEGNNLLLQEPFDLSAAVREAVEMHEWEAKRRQIDFSLETTPNKCFVCGDAARVRQIVVNTVSNSVKYTDRGHINVIMRKRTAEERTTELPENCDMEVELTITDTGAGIPREKLEAIFREFEQVESVIADPNAIAHEAQQGNGDVLKASAIASQEQRKSGDSDSGLGLGLAIVARVVKNLGGQLRVDSTVGEGSRFTYYLPFKASSPGKAAEASESEGQMRRSNSLDSGGSNGSSVKSEINSLVEAISAPHLDDTRSTPLRSSFDGGRDDSRSIQAAGSPARRGAERREVGNRTTSIATLIQGPQRPVNPRMGSNEGTMQVTDSAVPLRSVKIDSHELDTSGTGDHQVSQSSQEDRKAIQAAGSKAEVSTMSHRFDAGSQSNRIREPGFVRLPPHNESLQAEANSSPGSGSNDSTSNTALGGRGSSTNSISTRRRVTRARVQASAQANANAASAGQAPEKLSVLRVLVVEDDPINRMILKKRLGMDGHTVMLAVNGEEGVRQFEENGNEMDVILMDLQMPICNGQDACKRIRAYEKERLDKGQHADRPPAQVLNGRIPIFAVSATLDFKMRQEMCDIGMDGWVLKPIDFARLKSIMRGLTQLEHRERERWKPGHTWEKGGWLSEPAHRPLAGGANPL